MSPGINQGELDRAWLEEAKRRLEAVRSGAAVFASEDVERELEELLEAPVASRPAG